MSLPAPNAAEIRQPSSDGIAKASNDNFAAARTGASGGDSGVCVWWGRNAASAPQRARHRRSTAARGPVNFAPRSIACQEKKVATPCAGRPAKLHRAATSVSPAPKARHDRNNQRNRARQLSSCLRSKAVNGRSRCRPASRTGCPGAIDGPAYSPNSRLASSASGGSSSSPVSFLISSLFLSRKV